MAAQPKAKIVKTKADDDFLDGLLGDVNTNVPRPTIQPKKRPQDKRRTRALSPSLDERKQHIAKRTKVLDSRPPSSPLNGGGDDDEFMNMGMDDDDDSAMADIQPSSPVAKAVERRLHISTKDGRDDDDDDDMMEVAHAAGITTASVNISGTRPAPKLIKKELHALSSSPPTRPAENSEIDAAAWTNVTDKLNVLNSSQATESASFGKADHSEVVEEDGSLRFFWTDYTESNGSLCLFGKVLNKKSGVYVSCFVKIDNILRKLFFLPREFRQQNGRDTINDVDMKDVYEEVDDLMTKLNVGMHMIKPCTRKYAFELPDIPKEADYLKLLYPYSSKYNF